MTSIIRNAFLTLVCSLSIGCPGLTLGPVVERRVIVVRAGVPIQILDQVEVRGRVISEDGVDVVTQDIGGWIVMHPDHWDTVKEEVNRLRERIADLEGND